MIGVRKTVSRRQDEPILRSFFRTSFFRCRGSSRSGGRRIAGAAAIGTSSSKAFKGHFDGDDHTVKGLNIEKEVDYQGLFGYVQNTDNGNRVSDEGYRKSGPQRNNLTSQNIKACR